MRYRLLALDIDGTLLDPYGELTDSVRESVAVARRRGLEVVLCTGRRFRTALPIARDLGLLGPIVVNNGVLVKDLSSGSTLDHRFLEPEVYPEALELMRAAGPPLVYVDGLEDPTDLLTERSGEAHPFQTGYLDDNTLHFRVVEDLGRVARHRLIMVSAMADEATLAELRTRVEAALADRVRVHSILNKNYEGMILEVLSPDSGKWGALARLAAAEGIPPEEIVTVGDDTNDVEMLRCAGWGIAMGNAVDAAREAADTVVRGNAEGGLAEAIERVLLAL